MRAARSLTQPRASVQSGAEWTRRRDCGTADPRLGSRAVPPRPVAIDPPQIRIRRARRDDLAALIDLENGVFSSDRMSARQLRHHLANPRAEILVAVRDGVVARRRCAVLSQFGIGSRASIRSQSPPARAAAGSAQRCSMPPSARRGRGAARACAWRSAATMRPRTGLYERRATGGSASTAAYYEDGHDALRYEKEL